MIGQEIQEIWDISAGEEAWLFFQNHIDKYTVSYKF